MVCFRLLRVRGREAKAEACQAYGGRRAPHLVVDVLRLFCLLHSALLSLFAAPTFGPARKALQRSILKGRRGVSSVLLSYSEWKRTI